MFAVAVAVVVAFSLAAPSVAAAGELKDKEFIISAPKIVYVILRGLHM